MMLVGGALAAYLSTCAPSVAPSTMAAIVGVESGGNALALHDNTTRRVYAPRDVRTALAIADELLARGHSVDVGIAQVNSANFGAFGVDAARMLEPCANLNVASRILGGAYAHAVSAFPNPGEALWHAISAYNTGSLFAGRAYVAAVVAEAIRPPAVPAIAILTGAGVPLAPIMPPVSSGAVTRSHLHLAASVQRKPQRARVTSPLPFGKLRTAGITRTLSIEVNHART